MKKPELKEEQWAKIAPLLPEPKKSAKGGPTPVPNRPCFEGILWVLRSGARWKDLPEGYPHRTPGDHYTDVSFRQAIIRAVPKVFPMPAELLPDTTRMHKAARRSYIETHGLAAYRDHHKAVLAWYAERSWHPNQLRHTVATRVRSMFKLDAAQVVLGHQKADTT